MWCLRTIFQQVSEELRSHLGTPIASKNFVISHSFSTHDQTTSNICDAQITPVANSSRRKRKGYFIVYSPLRAVTGNHSNKFDISVALAITPCIGLMLIKIWSLRWHEKRLPLFIVLPHVLTVSSWRSLVAKYVRYGFYSTIVAPRHMTWHVLKTRQSNHGIGPLMLCPL